MTRAPDRFATQPGDLVWDDPGITGQVIGLAFNPAELRDTRGRWTRGGSVMSQLHRDPDHIIGDTHTGVGPAEGVPPARFPAEIGLPSPVRVAPHWRPVKGPARSAIKDYIDDDGNSEINHSLRHGRMPGGTGVSASGEPGRGLPRGDEVALIDQEITRHRLAQDTVLYRGVALTPDLARKLRKGATFHDKAFISVSSVKEWADDFAEVRTRGRDAWGNQGAPISGTPVIMRLFVPKGTPIGPGAANLGEYLLARGTGFRSRGFTPDGGFLDLDVLP